MSAAMSSNKQLVNTSMRARPRRGRGGGAHSAEGGEPVREGQALQRAALVEGRASRGILPAPPRLVMTGSRGWCGGSTPLRPLPHSRAGAQGRKGAWARVVGM